jgi:hypothetical protein
MAASAHQQPSSLFLMRPCLGEQPKNRDGIDELRVFQGCVSLVPARNQLYTCGIRDDLMRDRPSSMFLFRHTRDADIAHCGSIYAILLPYLVHFFIYSWARCTWRRNPFSALTPQCHPPALNVTIPCSCGSARQQTMLESHHCA